MKPPPVSPAKIVPASVAAFVSAATEACVRRTSTPLPATSRSTRLVAVTGTATAPVVLSPVMRDTSRSKSCSTGTSRPSSSTSEMRSAVGSMTTPRSAPTAVTSRLVLESASSTLVGSVARPLTYAWAATLSTSSSPRISGRISDADDEQ